MCCLMVATLHAVAPQHAHWLVAGWLDHCRDALCFCRFVDIFDADNGSMLAQVGRRSAALLAPYPDLAAAFTC